MTMGAAPGATDPPQPARFAVAGSTFHQKPTFRIRNQQHDDHLLHLRTRPRLLRTQTP